MLAQPQRQRRAAPRRAWSAGRSRPGPSLADPGRPGRSGSAWRSAASRICCCWAITASCGFGRSSTGASNRAATRVAAAGRREMRGRKMPGGTARTDARASARWRRMNRSASAAPRVTSCDGSGSPSGWGPADSGNSDREFERAGGAVAEPTFGVESQRGLTELRPRPTGGDEPAGEARERDHRGDQGRRGHRHEPCQRPEPELDQGHEGQGQPCPTNQAPHPQPTPIRQQRTAQLEQDRIERAGQP